MPSQSSNTNVSKIEVEVDRAVDRAGKQDQIRSSDNTLNITGSGGTGTVATNGSTGNWYLENVTAHALAPAGTVRIEIQVRNSSGTVKARQVIDGSGGRATFGGQVVKPDWDVFADVSQSDSNTYGVDIYPLFRQPDPSDSAGGGTDDDTVTTTDIIDDFEDGEIGEYSGDTGSFTVVSSPTYQGNNALQADNTGATREITSTSGLENYPEQGDDFEVFQRSTAVGGSGVHRSWFGFADDSGGDKVTVRTNWADFDNVYLFVNGSLQDSAKLSESLSADTWYKYAVEWASDDTVTVNVYESDSSTSLGSVSASAQGATGPLVQFQARTEQAGENIFFDHAQVTDSAE